MQRTKLKPIHRRVLVKLDARLLQTQGGIALPSRSQEATEWGEIINAADDCEELQQGDRVFIPSHMGTHYIEDDGDFILIEEIKVVCRELRVCEAA